MNSHMSNKHSVGDVIWFDVIPQIKGILPPSSTVAQIRSTVITSFALTTAEIFIVSFVDMDFQVSYLQWKEKKTKKILTSFVLGK